MNSDLMALFLESCGAAESLAISIASPNLPYPEVRSFRQPFIVIGRDAKANLASTTPQVSPCACLQVIAGRLFYLIFKDSDADQGKTEVQSGWLAHPQALQVGTCTIKLHKLIALATGSRQVQHEIWSPLSSPSLGQHRLPEITLELWNGNDWGEPHAIQRTLALVGRSGNCYVRLSDPSVAPFHCYLLRTPAGVWAVDLLGGTGLLVNETRVRWARLDDGDQLRIGKCWLRVSYETPMNAQIGDAVGALHGNIVTSPQLSPTQLPRPREPAGVVGTLAPATGSLVDQFSRMHRQMIEQFQEHMSMTMRMFGDFQRDQTRLLQHQMDQLQDLTGQLRDLHQELFQRLRNPGKRAMASPGRIGSGASLKAVGEAGNKDKDLDTAFLREAESSAAATDSTVPPAQQGRSNPDTEMHAWLHERIAAIRDDQQGRWQRLVKTLVGK
ncbi:MAG TPA: FHA domain-containing protein [Gemmataceae bacterium]|nr:FHA domain-containing protein [Gemmataceae bacterium]